MTRYVLYQRAFSPTSIVGSIHAADLVEAANTARAMYGSFHVTEWSCASPDQRAEAERMDGIADLRSIEAEATT
jgi:hypothetical protein